MYIAVFLWIKADIKKYNYFSPPQHISKWLFIKYLIDIVIKYTLILSILAHKKLGLRRSANMKTI